MSIRKLRGYPRTMEMAQKLNEFITSSMGKSHQASPMKLLGKSFKVMVSFSWNFP